MALTVALGCIVLVAAGMVAWRRLGGRSPSAQTPPHAPAAGPAPSAPEAPSAPDAPSADPSPDDAEGDATGEPSGGDALDGLRARRGPWAAVDLDAVRQAMPDNVYWTMGVPTRDPAVLRAREETRERWNTEYGRVLSNTATAEEIDAFYAHRERLSNDYIEFATYLLAYYGEKLPRRDVALLKLAIDMHLARLEEIPRQITEAQERREQHEAARRAWLEQQQAFEGGGQPDER